MPLRLVGGLLRVFGYMYHLILALFALGVAVVALGSRSVTLQLEMLPWGIGSSPLWLMLAAVIGLASVAAAVTGKTRVPYAAYALAILVILVRGLFLGPYTFGAVMEWTTALWLLLGALLAVLGAVSPRTERQ